MKRLSVLAILFFLTLFLMSCGGSSEPPYFGVFLEEDGELLEMVEFRGKPDSPTADGIPSTTDSEPVIVMWYPDINLDYLNMSSLTGAGRVDFNVSPRDGDVLEIRPVGPLAYDTYCLTQGDPLLPYQSLSNWCFRTGELEIQSSTVTPSVQQPAVVGQADQIETPVNTQEPTEISSCEPITGDWQENDGDYWLRIERAEDNVFLFTDATGTFSGRYDNGVYRVSNQDPSSQDEILVYCANRETLVVEIVGQVVWYLLRNPTGQTLQPDLSHTEGDVVQIVETGEPTIDNVAKAIYWNLSLRNSDQFPHSVRVLTSTTLKATLPDGRTEVGRYEQIWNFEVPGNSEQVEKLVWDFEYDVHWFDPQIDDVEELIHRIVLIDGTPTVVTDEIWANIGIRFLNPRIEQDSILSCDISMSNNDLFEHTISFQVNGVMQYQYLGELETHEELRWYNPVWLEPGEEEIVNGGAIAFPNRSHRILSESIVSANANYLSVTLSDDVYSYTNSNPYMVLQISGCEFPGQ